MKTCLVLVATLAFTACGVQIKIVHIQQPPTTSAAALQPFMTASVICARNDEQGKLAGHLQAGDGRLQEQSARGNAAVAGSLLRRNVPSLAN